MTNPVRSRIAAAVLAGLAGAACGPVTEPPPALLWEGEFIPVQVDDPLDGSAAMVSTSTTQIGIGVANAPAQAVLGWNVRSGTCDGAGEVLAPQTSFPPVAVDGDGDGTAEMQLNRRLGDGVYAAQLFADNSGGGLLLACADLLRVTLQ